MTHVADLFAHAAKVNTARQTETLAEAQAALDRAEANYDKYPSSSHAFAERKARERVEAARARDSVPEKTFEEKTTEWRNSAAGQAYMDLPPSRGTLAELRYCRKI